MVYLEISHQEILFKLVGQVVAVEIIVDEPKENVVGFAFLVRQKRDDARYICTTDQSQENEGLKENVR